MTFIGEEMMGIGKNENETEELLTRNKVECDWRGSLMRFMRPVVRMELVPVC